MNYVLIYKDTKKNINYYYNFNISCDIFKWRKKHKLF